VTIEITNGKSKRKYRVNPYASTEVDWRYTHKNARWYFHSRYATPQMAGQAVLQLEREERSK
jgi:hypothetical protein